MPYMVAIGFDATLEELAPLDPQCKSVPGMQFADVTYVPNNVYPEGEEFTDLVFTVMDETWKNNVDAQFGLSRYVLMSEVTMMLLNNDDTFSMYNVRIQAGIVGSTARRNAYGWEVTYRAHIVEAIED